MHAVTRIAGYLLLSCLVMALAAGAALYWYAQSAPAATQLPVMLEVKPGSSLKAVAAQMTAAGLLRQPELFVLLARLRGESGKLKAGNYEFSGALSPLELLQRITRGDVTQVSITFVEGWTFRQIRAALREHPQVHAETATLSESDLVERLGIPQSSAEGWFFPDTYHFGIGTSDLAILRRAHRLMKRHLEREWAQRAPDLPLKSPTEALILASIIEKETGKASERGKIASVFINRLRIGMRLQTDPAVIYGMGDAFDGNIRKSDLVTDTPYNTYTRAGLPPTPIAMPGLESLRAALNPEAGDSLYFVARGDGTSKFSSTLAEHERAVDRYQRRKRP